MVGVVEEAHSTAADALARTPEMLAVLAQAGVVDAGGTASCSSSTPAGRSSTWSTFSRGHRPPEVVRSAWSEQRAAASSGEPRSR